MLFHVFLRLNNIHIFSHIVAFARFIRHHLLCSIIPYNHLSLDTKNNKAHNLTSFFFSPKRSI